MKTNTRIISRFLKASPGNLHDLEDILFTNNNSVSSSPIVLAVKPVSKGDAKVWLLSSSIFFRSRIKLIRYKIYQSVGIAYTDATTMHLLGVSQFDDNDTFSNFEVFFFDLLYLYIDLRLFFMIQSLLIQLSVKECILPEDSSSFEIRKIKSILERCDIVITEKKKCTY
jgi:DNA mismatch repair protein MSH2